MAGEPRHRIAGVEFELDVHSAELGRELLDRVARLHERSVVPLLDRVLSQLSGPQRVDRIDTLELELGALPLAGFEDELLRALETALREALRGRLGAATPPEQLALELLETFARTGLLPWWASRGDAVVREANALASERAPTRWLALLEQLRDDPAALARLARHVDAAALVRGFAERGGGRLHERLVVLERVVVQNDLLPAALVPTMLRAAGLAALADARHLRDEALFDALVVGAIERVPALFRVLREELARGRTSDLHATLERVVGPAPSEESASPTSPTEPARDEPKQHEASTSPADEHDAGQVGASSRVNEEEPGGEAGEGEHAHPESQALDELDHAHTLEPEHSEPGRSEPGRSEPGPSEPGPSGPERSEAASDHPHADAPASDHADVPDPTANQSGQPDELALATASSPERREPDSQTRVPPAQRAARRQALARLDVVEVDDAGLVLLWPFLPRFFARVGLLDPERRFVDEPARMQAIGLLSQLVREHPDPPEWRLPLAKLLCGLPIEQPFELERPLAPEQIGECEALIAALIANAEILRNMRVESFRAEFLARAGLLGVVEGTWLLRVERASHDLVLDRFPWSWSWLRLPWMSDPLRVEW